MIKKLLTCWALLLFLMAANPAPDPDPYRTAPLVAAIPTTAKVVWEDCGEPNAFYLYRMGTVVMCNELKPLGAGVIRAVLLHELAHAFFAEHDIAFTGSEEWAADELSAYVLLENGYKQDVVEQAAFFLKMGREEDPIDDHPGDIRRAGYLLCMAAQHDGEDVPFCYVDYARIKRTWKRILDGARLPF